MGPRIILVALAFLSACGGSADQTSSSIDSGTPGGEESCDGRADGWINIQQEYLDRLGEASNSELAQPTAQAAAAGLWVGTALLEHVREADSVGCASELRNDSDQICSRLGRLQPSGDAGTTIVERLRGECGE